MQLSYKLGFIFSVCVLVSACSFSKSKTSNSGGAIVRDEPPSPYGNPKQYKVLGKSYNVMESSKGYKEKGLASWYGKDFHGKRTSSGTPYNMHSYSAAHKTLPIPSYVQVTNLDNGKRLILRVDDRGPFKSGRIIDLSFLAAKELGVVAQGVARVEVVALAPYQNLTKKRSAPTVQVAASAANNKPSAAPIPMQTLSNNAPAYWIQVGAFGEHKNAQYLVYKLNDNHPAKIQSAQNIHRVLVGPYATAAQSEQIRKQLSEQGFDAPKIMRQ
ncbi:endolytic peptidoglycan transglycosylase RlpA [Gammaproteobacteria bacterium]|nr:endolytic peptidoglycan transglycosylase RlpA [Gammaproteobacteria bacterium]